jgi:uncharacterized protein (DUF2236 family)
MTVTRAELEGWIEALRGEIADPAYGIYGPRSVSWQISKEAVLFIGGGRAALLQLAHPFVAYAIDQHSATRSDPTGRFKRTFDNVFAMTFGHFDYAAQAARRLWGVHTRIHGTIDERVGKFESGTRYHANDEEALLWVQATLVDTAVQVYELVVRPLTDDEKEEHYIESKRFGRLFGISDRVMPATWRDFRRYFTNMVDSGSLGVGRVAREIGSFVMATRRRAYRPAIKWLEILTAGLMPPRLRASFGMRYGLPEKATFHASIAALRASHRYLPRRLRYQPAYVAARRRLAGLEERDPIGQRIEGATRELLTQAPLRRVLATLARPV